MARAGRKRKIGVTRESSGKVARTYVNPKQQVADQPHRVVVLEHYRMTQEAGSEFGRLMLRKAITPAQHEAGTMYAELAAQYRSALQCPPINPAAIDLSRVGKGHSGGIPDETATAIGVRYDRAFVACGDAGRRAQIAVKDFAILDKPVTDQLSLDILICGLNALVKHFGVDSRLQITDRPK